MSRPTIFDRVLKILEPERNNLKQRISFLEYRIKTVEDHLNQIPKFPVPLTHDTDPNDINIIESGRECGKCNMNLHTAHVCIQENCPMGLYEE